MTKIIHDTLLSLAHKYHLSKTAFMRWYKPIRPDVLLAGNGHKGRVFTPAQRALIVARLGRPTGRRPLSITGLGKKYGMSPSTFSKWVEPFRDELRKIGHEHNSILLTPLQERFLKQKLEPPK